MPASDPNAKSTLIHVHNVDDFPGAPGGTPTEVNITELDGNPIDLGAGPVGAGTPRTATASDSPDVTALTAANVLLTAANALQAAANALLATIDADTGTIAGDTTSIDNKTPALGAAAMAGSSPVTLATNDTHTGAVGTASDVDGVFHGQLRYTGEATEASRVLLATIDADTGAISSVEGTTADAAVTTDAAGTISAKLRGWIVLLLSYLATIGSAVKGFALQIAGTDGTNARLFRLDVDGHAQVDVLSGGGTVGGALEDTQGHVKTAVQLLDDAVATIGSASPAKSFQVTRPDPTYQVLDADRAANHADLPGTATGPAGVAIPAWARKAIFEAFLTAGGGGVTVPVTIYLRRKNTQIAAGGSRWIAWAAHTNIDTETAIVDTWILAVDDPENYDMIAGYIAGSAGVYEVQIGVAFAA